MIRADQLWIDIMLLFCKSFRREIQYTRQFEKLVTENQIICCR